MTRRPAVSVFRSLAVLALMAAPLTAAAQQVCDDNTRTAYQNAVNAGATDAELEAQFGACRGTVTQGVVATVTNFNIFYEKMNSCGLHPQQRRPACDVEIRQNGGYGAFPAGSNENVLFCFDCDLNGIFEYSVPGSVHVTNNISPQTPSWYHSVNAVAANTPATCAWGSGRTIRIRAILSWSAKPTSCASKPIWGNWIDFQARLDP
ncbi:hypothetical protein JY651_37725 [Pyxidicoccus parkwayensis]|uniref:Uncharacterized protein n=1 Tax=Pyxidicoccus parkwayensis TaxID=2813578 RepID=A0ABX7NRF0_9BACT|nr:hypothetical protein [Pyxidicoccus parkwaysis]QSQ20919.1 hypothetical protein JY651_37725 [Pyxidicoccus parkwaysis]